MREFHLDSGDRGSHFEPGLNRDRLCCQRSRRISSGVSEVQSLFVCLFVGIKPETLYFAPCVWREVITPGNGRTRAVKPLRLFHSWILSFTQHLDAWMREFHLYSGDRGSHFKPGLNRDRLCGQRSRRSSRGVSAESCGGEETCSLVRWNFIAL